MMDPPGRPKGHRVCPACSGPQQLSAKKVGGHLVWAFVCHGCGRVDEPPERRGPAEDEEARGGD